ncbi:MAG: lasso peptide biosynthesis B2 protein [Saprospiraceae bacterium]|nr:lasso peptide biosynthesis B2 protein [Saprospiraceae bacterium]
MRSLSAAEIRLIPAALYHLVWAKYVVACLPAKKYLPVQPASPSQDDISTAGLQRAETICGVVEGLSRRLPWRATCLMKVLAADRLLAGENIAAVIHLGISHPPENDALGAHAWLSVGNKTLLGGYKLDRYREVARLSSAIKPR